jgi:hypothetical protein
MKPEPLLGWRQSGEEAEIDIGIMVRDVDVRVMEEGVVVSRLMWKMLGRTFRCGE